MGKNVLIIGASGDIGVAIASRLAEDGYQLLLHYNKNREMIDKFRNKINNDCVLTVIQADLRIETETKRLLTELVFPVDYIIFASGTAHFGLFQDTSEQIMDEMLALHVKAPWMITKHLLPSMIRQQFGKIVFITSIWGEQGASNEVIYSSVKGAQNSFVKALAKEVAPSGIAVNAVSPGFIETKMNNNLTNEEKKELYNEIPMNRAGKPSEVAGIVHFLLEDNSSYIQGEIINMTGGW
ncbi:3-ketoacyl-ACP reductase [Virgibacillus profundi]|uniref:3-ketoacyl-ACP reductase n=1 Tax=Virgibacillus profundi TaxID=2024555 RepID=A0A2A2IG11_9BACI|nr:SDR family oxidoreductase [Virgibacillus profundi]PAV30065.1 3-ketoacyl-ACP reductase [Virgibacillus profundi]PXY54238.1 KR domain-containing protein [Virgibacillus profundi]